MATYYMDTNGSTAGFGTLTGTWDNGTTAVWTTNAAGTSATSAVTFTNVDVAQFGRSGTTATAGTVTIAAATNITVNQIVIQNIISQTIAGGAGATLTPAGTTPTINVSGILTISAVIAGAGGFTKTGVSGLTLSGVNTYTGPTTISTGMITANNAAALGSSASSAATTLASGVTLRIGNGITLDKSSSVLTSSNGTIDVANSTTGTATFSSIALSGAGNTSLQAGSSGTLTITNPITGAGTANGITVNSSTTSGTVRLSNVGSSYVGATTVAAGTLEVAKLADVGVASSIGAPALAQSAISLATASSSTTLSHIGTTVDSTDREIILGSAFTVTFSANGTGSGQITYSSGGALTHTVSGNRSITFTGTGANNNTFARVITDPPTSGATSLTKQGTGRWVISGENTFTGGTQVTAGELVVGHQNAFQNSIVTIGNTGVTLSFDGSLTTVTLGGLSAGVLAGINVVIPVGLTLSVGNSNSGTTYSNDLTGSGTFNKIGTSSLILGGGAGASLTCPFSVSAGTLNFGSQNRTLSGGLSISGGTASASSNITIAANTTMTGGTITAVLAGANTLTVSSGTATIQPNNTTTGGNTHTGNTTISGTADLITPIGVVVSTAGNGYILGTNNTTTITGTGKIRTKASGTFLGGTKQRGQARYNNLNLLAGASLEIGNFI